MDPDDPREAFDLRFVCVSFKYGRTLRLFVPAVVSQIILQIHYDISDHHGWQETNQANIHKLFYGYPKKGTQKKTTKISYLLSLVVNVLAGLCVISFSKIGGKTA